MSEIVYTEVAGTSAKYWGLLAALGGVIAVALGCAYYMEHNGHYVTGMNNQIVWGMPHVFALFLIVSASGALNIASIGSVFGKKLYKPLARLSCLLAIALLIGGLIVLLLDLGRPDRLIVAMTTFNFKSIFAWNIILYTGFMAIVAVYLWMMMERKMNKYSTVVGYAAFIWRLILTTGTGSIFGFLVARQAYDEAIMAPMFVIMSFSFGLAIYILVLFASFKWTNRELGDVVVKRLKNLLGVFIAAVLYFVMVFHVTNLYMAEHQTVEHFILAGGNKYTTIFWLGQIIIGSLLPLFLLYFPVTAASRKWIAVACGLTIYGGFSQLYVILIGGQAIPLTLFPEHTILSSGFNDGVNGAIHSYSATAPEFLLGLGGVAVAMLIVTFAIKILRFVPASLADSVADPHHK